MVLDALLSLHPTILVVSIGLIFSVLMVLLTKYVTDQDLMKRLREETKELQAEMKELKNNPSKMGEVNKRMMETNMKMMMQSLRPMLFSMIPALLIFTWLNGHLAYEPLTISEEFSVDLEFYDNIMGTVVPLTPEGVLLINGESYTIKDNHVRLVYTGEVPGDYTLTYELRNDLGETLKSWSVPIIIVEEDKKGYEGPVFPIKDDQILKTITVSNEKFTPFGSLNIFGWHPGWLALYIFVSIIASLVFRKVFKVY